MTVAFEPEPPVLTVTRNDADFVDDWNQPDDALDVVNTLSDMNIATHQICTRLATSSSGSYWFFFA